MRTLLDECVPRKLRQHLPGIEVRTVAEMRWSGKENGELLALIRRNGFAAFITVDQNIPHQQNLAAAGVAVIVLAARTNKIEDLAPLVPGIRRALEQLRPGEVCRIETEPTSGP